MKKHLPKFLVASLFATSLFFLATPPAHAMGKNLGGRTCRAVMVPAAPDEPFLGSISRSDPTKNILLADTVVKDQGKYGCCWISAAIGRFERVAKKVFGEQITLSEDHLVMASIFYRVEEALYFGDDISEGGWSMTSDWLAKNVGLVPAKEWKPKLDFRDPAVGTALIKELNTEIEAKLAELAARKNALPGPPTELQEIELWKFLQDAKSEIYAKIRGRMGNFPTKFEVGGKTYTPHSFAAKLNEGDGREVLMHISSTETRRFTWKAENKKNLRPEQSAFQILPELKKFASSPATKYKPDPKGLGSPEVYRLLNRSIFADLEQKQGPFTAIHDILIQKLAAKEAVYIEVAIAGKYVDSKNGLMSITAQGQTKADIVGLEADGAHAMVITGAYRDSRGKVLGYRIQNSWGEAAGERGYFFMDRDYFEAFYMAVIVPDRRMNALRSL